MTKHIFPVEIVMDGPNPVTARNKLLSIVAKLELDGEIYHGQVGMAEK